MLFERLVFTFPREFADLGLFYYFYTEGQVLRSSDAECSPDAEIDSIFEASHIYPTMSVLSEL